MLIQFSVENFGCFKEKTVLSMLPSADKEHEENISKNGKYKSLNFATIYGANASGKTTLFKALTVAMVMVRMSSMRQVNQPLQYIPFKFDMDTATKPSSFEFIFVANDGNRYVYGFSADYKKVYEEYLYVYKSQRPACIFERKNVNEYTYTKSQKNILQPLERFNTENKMFLATATAWNCESTKAAYEWLALGIDTFTEATDFGGYALDRYKGPESKQYLKFTEKLLQQADINITNLDFSIKNVKIDDAIRNMMPGFVVNGQVVQPPEYNEEIKVTTEHKILVGKNNYKSYRLDLNEESSGTHKLFYLGPIFKDAFENGKTLVVDEIEKNMHTHIIKHLVDMFRNPEINKNGAQLIFTTHDTSLLSLETYRRDQILFTEKNNNTGVSELYSLDEFGVRKNENIQKGYLLGRYGAIPFIRGEELI